PGPEQKFELFATAVERFLTAGYIQIGMDHFARPDDELAQALDNGTLHRNFMGYTTKRTGDMLGVGMSAIGNISGAFAQNLSGLDSYMNTIGEGKPAIYRGYQLSRDDHIRQAVIISIMCNFVLKFDDLKKAFGIDYFGYFRQEDEELEVFIDDGLMKRTGNSIEVCP
ncbi:MAG TPA: coproporphyrinogen III oxidase, partial [candidate division Zixibacteria bacterium]|nr:coproporphyrinogen III oxidase [candidate division Zixibacteria bacterium]